MQNLFRTMFKATECHLRKAMVSILAIALASTVVTSPAFAVGREEAQKLKDLCQFSIYMQFHARMADRYGSDTVVSTLLDDNNPLYPEGSQERMSFLKRIDGVDEILLAAAASGEFESFFANITYKAMQEGDSFGSLCGLYDIDVGIPETGQWLQENIDRPTYRELIPKITDDLGPINETSNDAISSKSLRVSVAYVKGAIARNANAYHKFSLQGEAMIEEALKEGIEFPHTDGPATHPQPNVRRPFPEVQEEDFSNLFRALTGSLKTQKNPLSWNVDYFSGISIPNTLQVWRLYLAPLPEESALVTQAIEHIKDGTFEFWWPEQFAK